MDLKKGEYIEFNKEVQDRCRKKKKYRDLLRLLLIIGNSIVIFYFVGANLLKDIDIYFVNEMYSFMKILASAVIVIDIVNFIHVNHINKGDLKSQILKSSFIAALGLGALYVNSIDFNEHLISGAQITYQDKQIFMNDGKIEYYQNLNKILMKKIPPIKVSQELEDINSENKSNVKFASELEQFILSKDIDFNKHAHLLPYMGREILNKKFGTVESLGGNICMYNNGGIVAEFSEDGKTLIKLNVKSNIAQYEGIEILDRDMVRFTTMVQVAGVAMTPIPHGQGYMLINEETHVDVKIIVEDDFEAGNDIEERIIEVIYENSDYV